MLAPVGGWLLVALRTLRREGGPTTHGGRPHAQTPAPSDLRQRHGDAARLGALTGGVAYAANTIGSEDIINGEVRSADIGNNQIQSIDVRDDALANGGLTGADIQDQSGVDTCVSATVRVGQLCFRAENVDRNWNEALEFCANLDLRLPTIAEAVELAETHDLPNVSPTEGFWTDELIGESVQEAVLVDDNGSLGTEVPPQPNETACVTTPTN